jgi:hypothetical protein
VKAKRKEDTDEHDPTNKGYQKQNWIAQARAAIGQRLQSLQSHGL